jgi:hypothetical protein
MQKTSANIAAGPVFLGSGRGLIDQSGIIMAISRG